MRLGELDLDAVVDDGAAPIDVPIESSLPHERYNAQILVNDIALLKLKNRVTFTSEWFIMLRGLMLSVRGTKSTVSPVTVLGRSSGGCGPSCGDPIFPLLSTKNILKP